MTRAGLALVADLHRRGFTIWRPEIGRVALRPGSLVTQETRERVAPYLDQLTEAVRRLGPDEELWGHEIRAAIARGDDEALAALGVVLHKGLGVAQ